jgi:hypothetical protein
MSVEIKGYIPKETNELRNRFGLAVVESVQEMVRNSEDAKVKGDLTRGIWYPSDYILALKQGNESSKTRYEWLRSKGHLVDGWLSNKHFSPVTTQMGIFIKRRAWNFLMKDEVLPSDALKAAKVGLSILDCGTVCQIARYDALLKILGEEKFNRLFSEPHGQKLNISFDDDALNPLRFFFDFAESAKKQVKGSIGKRIVQKGQMVSFKGVEKYEKKHPSGMGGNYNLICSNETPGEQRYVGHGLPSEGMTEEEIARMMVREYNQKPDHLSRVAVSQHKEMELILETRRSERLEKDEIPEKSALRHVKGYDRGSPHDVRVELIADLVRLPLQQVSMAYVRKHPAAY